MVEGTVGTDRECVASEYTVSAKNKSMPKLFLFAHWLVSRAQMLLLLPFLSFPLFLISGLYLEHTWLASLPFTILALMACNKSKTGMVFKILNLVEYHKHKKLKIFGPSPNVKKICWCHPVFCLKPPLPLKL